MQQLESTTPHFIRCIKPNSKKIPGAFENDLVSEQLRCCGILEVVRISRSGYPTRMTHQEFTRRYCCYFYVHHFLWMPFVLFIIWWHDFRYGILLPNNNNCQDALSSSIAILQQFDIHPEMYQVGYTKLFFRAGQVTVFFLKDHNFLMYVHALGSTILLLYFEGWSISVFLIEYIKFWWWFLLYLLWFDYRSVPWKMSENNIWKVLLRCRNTTVVILLVEIFLSLGVGVPNCNHVSLSAYHKQISILQLEQPIYVDE